MKKYFLLLALLGFVSFSFAQKGGKKKEEAQILTSSVCGMCKQTIETAVMGVKGVRSVNLNTETHYVKVVFSPAKTNVEAIRHAIVMAGYDADSQPADPKAYENLHSCCKKEAAH